MTLAAPTTRSLLYLPIIHTPAGPQGDPVRPISAVRLGGNGWQRKVNRVEALWTRIEQVLESLGLHYDTVRIYQERLPHGGHELAIVTAMAKAGSRNHRLLLQMQEKGATLMGTESPELLRQEYELMKEILSSAQPQEELGDPHQKEVRKSLLQQRDAYIATRINSTLCPHETGVLFLGCSHPLAALLDSDIRVAYPLAPIHAKRPATLRKTIAVA